jgi:hypothetical protein
MQSAANSAKVNLVDEFRIGWLAPSLPNRWMSSGNSRREN